VCGHMCTWGRKGYYLLISNPLSVSHKKTFLIPELQMLNRLAEEEVEGAQQDLHEVEESVGIPLSWDQVCFRKLK